MPKDHEWAAFVQRDDQFVDPDLPIRSAQFIHYPGRDHYACQEIRAGLLERKSKYLKSYTAGWYATPCHHSPDDANRPRYVLSPTHLHEFKSADKTQAPVMSLYLPEQKLGSHSTEGGSSNKFILKGRQTGSMHRGHTWVFRAESHDTMMAWYEDIKALTEKTPQERSEFVRGHSRSISRSSQRSVSSDGVVDEPDEEPFAAEAAVAKQTPRQDMLPRRPSPGGRFPSDIEVNAARGLQAPLSPSSASSGFPEQDRELIAAAGALPGGGFDQHLLGYGGTTRTPLEEAPSRGAVIGHEAQVDGVNPYTGEYLKRGSAYAPAVLTNGVVPRTLSGREAQKTPLLHGADRGETGQPGLLALRGPEAAPGGGAGVNSAAVAGTPATSSLLSSLDDRAVQERQASGTAHTPVKTTRPTSGPRSDSVPTISHLHIPGEFPKAAPAS